MTLEFDGLREERIKQESRLFELLKRCGIDFATGVPCGVQKYLISSLSTDTEIKHVPATKESEAIGIAAGAYLAGRTPLIYMQNSGLLNSINDITSLLIAYKIPAIFTVSWRGAPGEDAPQHLINGCATTKILDDIGIVWKDLTPDNMECAINESFSQMRQTLIPSCILIRRGALGI